MKKTMTTIKITRASEITPSLYTIEGSIRLGEKPESDENTRAFIFHMDAVNDKTHIFFRKPSLVSFSRIMDMPHFTVDDYKNRSVILWLYKNRERLFA